MKKLLIYLKEYKKESILGPLFKLLEASFELFVPLVIAAIVDRGIGGGDKMYIIKMCCILILLAAVGLASSLTAQYFAAKASVGFVAKIRSALFAHIQTLSHKELDDIGTPTLITRMTSDINQVQTGLNLTLRLLLRSPFVVFGSMIMAFTVDFKSALIFAVTIPILSVVVFTIMLVSIPLYKKVQSSLDAVLGITRENLTGSRVIRAFCKEDEEIQSFTEKNEALTAVQKFTGRISALMNPLTFAIVNFAIIVLIYTGALRVESGLLTQGAVIALYNYMSQILVELIKLANLIINITKSIACGNRIQSVFDIESSLECGKDTNQSKSGQIEFKNVTLRYNSGADAALSDISFRADPGETIGIIGGTGSGKSSLINLIPHFYDIEQGSICIDGIDVRNYDTDALRKKIAIVPQKSVLFSGTIRSNLLFGNENASESDLDKALKIAQAADFVAEKPGMLDSPVEQGGKNFSGGQRQRLAIARALVKNSEILILDDASSALDYATDAALRKSLSELEPRPTVIIASQRAASVMHADKIIVLDNGSAVGIGTHDELLKTCDVYKEIYNSQFKKEEQSCKKTH